MTSVLIISSYPYDKSGITIYTAKLIKELSGTKSVKINTFTMWLARQGTIKYLRKSILLIKVLIVNKFDIYHFQYTPTSIGPLFPIFLLLARLRGASIVTTIHENMGVYAEGRAGILRWLLFRYESLILFLSSRLIVMSNRQKKELLVAHSNLSAEKVELIPFGIDSFKVKTSTKNKQIIIGFFGFIKKGKGLETLAASSTRLAKSLPPNTQFLIAGHAENKTYLSRIKKLFQPMNEQLTWLGFLSDAEMKVRMCLCTCIVLPYEKSTNSAILMDAISAEVPVAVTDVGSFKEIVENWRIGEVCPPKNSVALAEAIEKIVKTRSQRESLISNIRSLKATYSWSFVATEHLRVYLGRHQ
jgi:glycosyltransferase involved in cell wall biosynthesis